MQPETVGLAFSKEDSDAIRLILINIDVDANSIARISQ